MSLVLKNNLAITPTDECLLVVLILTFGREYERYVTIDAADNIVIAKGAPIPAQMPLSPIAALAFAMAGFVVRCSKFGHTYTANAQGHWIFAHQYPDGRWEADPGLGTGPTDPVIVGHLDPEVL